MGKSYVQTGRFWLLEIYPESCVLNWEDVLEKTHFPIAVSPLHDCDVFKDTDKSVLEGKHVAGELKKPHYHICLDCGPKNNKSIIQIREIAKQLAKDPNHPVEPLLSGGHVAFRGAVRYLIHLDNPTKYQYDFSGIKTFNGFDLAKYFTTNDEEWKRICRALQHYITEFNITEYWDLLESLDFRFSEDFEGVTIESLYMWVTKHTIHTNSLIKSRKGSIIEKLRLSDNQKK